MVRKWGLMFNITVYKTAITVACIVDGSVHY